MGSLWVSPGQQNDTLRARLLLSAKGVEGTVRAAPVYVVRERVVGYARRAGTAGVCSLTKVSGYERGQRADEPLAGGPTEPEPVLHVLQHLAKERPLLDIETILEAERELYG